MRTSVMPKIIDCPDARSGSMPADLAAARSPCSVGVDSSTRRTAAVIGSTSNSPVRPR